MGWRDPCVCRDTIAAVRLVSTPSAHGVACVVGAFQPTLVATCKHTVLYCELRLPCCTLDPQSLSAVKLGVPADHTCPSPPPHHPQPLATTH